MCTVVLPQALRGLARGERTLDLSGATVGEVLDALGAEHPALVRRIRDEQGALRRFVNVYVDGEDVRFCGGTDAAVGAASEVRILPSVAGG